MAIFTFEHFYGADAQRNGLVALVPAPSSSWTITGTNWIEPTRKARILKNLIWVTNTAADVVGGEAAFNASHDPNYIRWYNCRDQTTDFSLGLHKLNYPLIDGYGNTAIMRCLESNANVAEISNIYVAFGDESFKGLTMDIPSNLPPNARWITGTATITSVLGQWVTGAITWNYNFNPKSKYQILGAGCTGAGANTLSGFRFHPKASSEPADLFPGAPCGDALTCMTVYYEDTGQPWLIFDGANPPDLGVSAVAAAAQAPIVQVLIAEV